VYLSVDDRQNMDVYFDDLKVTHELNDIVAGGDYYPFGSVMTGREITRDDYRFGYQGQFAEKDEETGWNSFEARMYSSEIGRWLTTDPAGQFASPYLGMGNNPANGVDPDGRDWYLNNKGKVENLVGVTGEVDGYDLVMRDDISYLLPGITINSNPVEVAASGNMPTWLMTKFNTGGFEMGFGVTFTMGPQNLNDAGPGGYTASSGAVTLLKIRPTLKGVYGEGFGGSSFGFEIAGNNDKSTMLFGGRKEGIYGLFDIKGYRNYVMNNNTATLDLNKTSVGGGTRFTEILFVHDHINNKSELKIGIQEDWAGSAGLRGLNFGVQVDFNIQGTFNQR
jgi:RHS repeat-associated protein